MADNKYELTIKLEDNSSNSNNSSQFAGIESPQSSKSNSVGGFISPIKSIAKGVATVLPVAQLVNYEISRVGVENGNSLQQTKINSSMSIAKRAIGVAGAFAVGGPIAGIGALTAIGVDYYTKNRTFEYESAVEMVGVNQARQRAGISFNQSR